MRTALVHLLFLSIVFTVWGLAHQFACDRALELAQDAPGAARHDPGSPPGRRIVRAFAGPGRLPANYPTSRPCGVECDGHDAD